MDQQDDPTPAPQAAGGSPGSPQPLRVLVAEDSVEDAELMVHELRKAGYSPEWTRTETARTFSQKLAELKPEVVLSDYRMPRFDGMEALRIAQREAPGVPVIVVTGSVNEEVAVLCMKAGAADYVLKESLSRLGVSVQAALESCAVREAKETAEEEVRLRGAALEAVANGLVITDAAGLIQWVNPAFTAMTGWPLEEVRGRRPSVLKSGVHPDTFYRALWETISSGQVWRGEVVNRRKDGSLYDEEMTITPVRGRTGTIDNYVAVKQDLTERQRREEEIRSLSIRDPLTRLPSRSALQASLADAVADASRGKPSVLALLDVDNLRVLNEAQGPETGDHLLRVLADILATEVGPEDVVARVGGDEFAILLPGVEAARAHAEGERFRRRIEGLRLTIGSQSFDVTVSVGVCPVDGALDASAVLAAADVALFDAKSHGRNRVALRTSADPRSGSTTELGGWAARVHDALRNELFVLRFQPVVTLATGTAQHHEVLLRMRDGKGGLVLPGAFLPAAERFGLMPQVDRWVVAAAVDALQTHPYARLLVNLSGATLGDEDLLSWIEETVARRAILPGRLAFELTETTAVTDLPWTARWIRRLKSVGCAFALDDFGTGFSSFRYLRSLPVDYVKIDGSFVRDIDVDPKNRALAAAMTSVAHTLGKEVIAEMVERPEVAEVLRELGVEHGQGWLWGYPAEEPRKV